MVVAWSISGVSANFAILVRLIWLVGKGADDCTYMARALSAKITLPHKLNPRRSKGNHHVDSLSSATKLQYIYIYIRASCRHLHFYKLPVPTGAQ